MWEWLFKINWERAGGSSFVELCTGINLAYFSWDKFRNKVDFVKNIYDGEYKALLANTLDEAESGISKDANKTHIQFKFIRWFDRCYRPVCMACCFLVLLGALVGGYMLFADRYCPHDWLLLMPIFVMFLASSAGWLLVKVTAEISKDTLKGRPTTGTVNAAVDKMLENVASGDQQAVLASSSSRKSGRRPPGKGRE